MGQVREEPAAKGVVTQVLNDGSAVGIRVRLTLLLRGGLRESLQDGGTKGVEPSGIDQSFVAKDGIGLCNGGNESEADKEKAPGFTGALGGTKDRVSPRRIYSASTRRFFRFRLRASASLVRRFSPGFR